MKKYLLFDLGGGLGDGNEPCEGIPKMFQALRKKGFQVIAGDLTASKEDQNSETEMIEKMLESFGINGAVKKEEVFWIGDTACSIAGAKEAGVESVGVAYESGSIEELSGAGADYIVQSVWELWDFLMREIRAAETKESRARRLPEVVLWFAVFFGVRFAAEGIWKLFGGGADAAEGTILLRAVSALVAGGCIFFPAKKWIEAGRIDRRLQYLNREPVIYGLIFLVAGMMMAWGCNLALFRFGLITGEETPFFVGFVCTAVIMPVMEELLFRGILYNYLRGFWGVWPAIFVSSAVFGICQGGIWQGNISYGNISHGGCVTAVSAFAAGILIAYGYEYFGLFRMAVILHVLMCAAAFLAPYVKTTGGSGAFVISCAGAFFLGLWGSFLLWKHKRIR